MRYIIRFSSYEDGEDFVEDYGLKIHWINDSDEYNKALVDSYLEDFYSICEHDDRVLQYSYMCESVDKFR